jgi:diacylglycerol kinase (ATP)
MPQNFGDGKIEFVGFNSMMGMANERYFVLLFRFIHGNAVRIA